MTVNEFDLSIGNIVSLGGVVAALLSIQGVPIPGLLSGSGSGRSDRAAA